MQTFQIAIGLVIIVTTFLDFFHTTLSGNGFGFISRALNRSLNRLFLRNRTRSIFRYSGLIHLLITTSLWLVLLFTGVYVIYTSGPDMVVNSTTLLPANYTERFYFSGYVLSTLGIGDFAPGNASSSVITAILSFTGFILITTGLTYLLSVVQALQSKKKLAFFINTLGQDVEELYLFFKKQDDLSSFLSDASDLRMQIIENASSYLAFPIVNYFLIKERKSVLTVQLAALYEVMEVLKLDWPKGTIENAKLTAVTNAIEKYLQLGLEEADSAPHNEEKLKTLRSFWRKYDRVYKKNDMVDRQFNSSLKYAGWNWEAVYKLKDQD